MANCIDFDMSSEFVNLMTLYGSLIKSKSFTTAMQVNREKCIRFVRDEYLVDNSQYVNEDEVYDCSAIESFCATIL